MPNSPHNLVERVQTGKDSACAVSPMHEGSSRFVMIQPDMIRHQKRMPGTFRGSKGFCSRVRRFILAT
jgi:hypothetical protein